MNIYKMINRPLKLLLPFAFVMMCMGCEKEAGQQFQVQVFSNVPGITLEEMEAHTNIDIENLTGIDIKQYPPVAERLLVEIASRSGDMIIVDRELLGIAYDSEALYPLTAQQTEENAVVLTTYERSLFLSEEESHEEEVILENALKVMSIEEFKYEEDADPIELIAVIPKKTKSKALAFAILDELVTSE